MNGYQDITLTQNQIHDFLQKIDKDYPIPLSQKVNTEEYAAKLCEKAHMNVVINDGRVLSLVAGYTENLSNNIAYIALVGTLSEARGNGYAKKLVLNFIDDCRKSGISGVHIYTASGNEAAISLYQSIGFVNYVLENEPRPNDMHFVYWIKENL